MIPTFISWLPVWNDVDEVPYVYDYFCDLVEANHPLVVGENDIAKLAKIFEIVLYTFSHGTFEDTKASTELEAVRQRMANIMKMLQVLVGLFTITISQAIVINYS